MSFSILRKTVRATGGTETDEFAAKIKSVTSSTTIGSTFIYDTRNDSDGGAWRKKCAGLSWYDEDLNTATRGGRREFPSVALIVADNAAGSETITIYDLDDVAAPMWLVFQMGGASESSRNFSGRAGENANSLFALNGRVMWGINADLSSGGVCIADFASDEGQRYAALASYTETGRVLSERNSAILPQRISGDLIVNGTVNDVAATIVEGAELGALGLPIPTIGVATDGGVSVIHPNGSVYDQTHTVYGDNQASHVTFDEKGGLSWASRNKSIYHLYLRNPLFADSSAAPDNIYYTTNNITAGKSVTPLGGGGTPITARANIGGRDFATGAANGLSVIKHNDGNPDEGMVSYHTSDYCTGYLLGDIRLALAAPYAAASYNYTNGASIGDRSVKANTLTTSAASGEAVAASAVATGSEVFAFSGFSADNYLSRAYDADFDFADGKVSVMCWVKVVAGSTYQAIANRYGSGDTVKGWFLYLDPNEKAYFEVAGASTVSSGYTSILADGWHFICGVSDGSKVKIYTDGVLASSATLAAGDLSNSSAKLQVGIGWDETNYPVLGSLSLLRISATAPTPQQVKDIYDAEAPLFRAGAKCLLAANQVNDLAYDSSTDLLHVASESTSSSKSFRGLEAVESLTSDGSLGLTAATAVDGITAAGGVLAGYDSAKVGVNLPPFDVRGDTNIADIKLPDDGKLHFSGVTTDATPTVIGFVPIAENETYHTVTRVVGMVYNEADSGYRFNGEIKQSLSRKLGGDIVEENEAYKLTESDNATLDFTIAVATGGSASPPNLTAANTQAAMLLVTGAAGTRIVWNATVEVQRISDKQYER